MNLTAEMLELRLALVARVHRVELDVARDEHARAAAALVRRKTHELGNAIQIVRLSSVELERRSRAPELAELVADIRTGSEAATNVLGDLLAAAAPPARQAGAAIVPVVRAALDRARPAIAARLELTAELGDDVRAFASDDELDALALAALLDADTAGATRVSLALRARTIARKPFIQLLCIDDRRDPDTAATPALIDALAERAGGEASLSPGRDGLELAVELPVADGQ